MMMMMMIMMMTMMIMRKELKLMHFFSDRSRKKNVKFRR
ncbi:unnamed protein product [Onchocerca flexuosa]|uniref:Uncharacterized protein n=1 Tax=Onchocerca flexuosa TaxID=387005 RepID=A0A183HSD5_9BILA|nr:unnamed protein product [Onchocerca flexuosa]